MTVPLTVAVVSWNTSGLLERCLASLAADAEAGLADVWVVDNASTDGSAEMVRQRFGWAQLRALDENLGFGRAVNLVAEATSSPWVAAANADLEFEPGALRRLVEAGESRQDAGAVAPRLISPDGSTQHSLHPFPGVGLGVVYNLRLARVVPGLGDRLCLEGAWDPERRRSVDWAHGALLVVRREAFEQVGLFDERQWMYAEDLDLGWRLARGGWKSLYEPSARVRHEISAAARKAFADERHARHVAAAYTWMARRRGMLATWAYAALNTAGAAMRWTVLAGLSRVRPGLKAGRDRERRYIALHRLGLRGRSRLVGETGE
jgi:N-acetylglucosaminyl-diphospho-decaprenol L-rhamnosyltransferase